MKIILAVMIGLAVILWFVGSWAWDFIDGFSNEMIFARESVRTLLVDLPWSDQSPLYFILLHFWKYFGESPTTTRVLLAILQVAGLWVVYRMTKDNWGRPAGVAAAGLCAFSFSMLWAMRSDGRMYPLVVLASLATFDAVMKYVSRQDRRHLVYFSIAVLTGIYTHFFGFYIAFWAFLYLILCEVWGALADRAERGFLASFSRRFIPVLLCAAVVQLAALPQIYRLFLLMERPPLRMEGWSLPEAPVSFIRGVAGLIYPRSEIAPELGRAASFFEYLYWALSCILFTAGLILASHRARLLILITSVGSVIPLMLLSARFDLRDRYLIYVVPMVLMTIASGGFAPLPRVLGGSAAKWVDVVRKAIFGILFVQTIWIACATIDGKYAEWSKLMNGLHRIYRPGMEFWMPTGHTLGIPKYTSDWNRLNPALREVEFMTQQNRSVFLEQVKQGKEFVFLVHKGRQSDEQSWRRQYLLRNGYRQETVHAWLAQAEVYSQKPNEKMYATRRAGIDNGETARILGEFLNRRPPYRRTRDLVASHIDADGMLHVSNLYLDQGGLNGYWKLPGKNYTDAVYEETVSFGGRRNKSLIITPRAGRTAVVGFPKHKIGKQIELVYGEPDRGSKNAGPIAIELWINDVKVFEGKTNGEPGWQTRRIDTAAYDGHSAHIILFVTTGDPNPRSLALGMKSINGRLSSYKTTNMIQDAAVVDWACEEASRAPASDAFIPQVAARIHSDGRKQKGILELNSPAARPVWLFSNHDWERVFLGRFKSAGEEKEMIWAHPTTNSTLVLAANLRQWPQSLKLVYGIADSGLWNPKGAPIRMHVWKGKTKLGSLAGLNEAGWKTAEWDTRDMAGKQECMAVLIQTGDQTARHFCFMPELAGATSVFQNRVLGKLSDDVLMLRVRRLSGGPAPVLPVRFDPTVRSAAQMHESGGPNQEGDVWNRWELGEDDWDTVGNTVQRSGGVVRPGIWAHPKDNAVLVIDYGPVMIKSRVVGYVGFTDYSVKQELAQKHNNSARLELLIDNKPVLDLDVPRVSGWQEFSYSSSPEEQKHAHLLSVRITSGNQRWAHVVFDLWSSE